MGTSEEDVRRLALAQPETTERSCYGTPAFYVAGKIFARIHDEPGVLVLWRADLGEREALLQSEPEKFFTTDHYRGHASVLARLSRLRATELRELLGESWYARAPARLRDHTS
ncbi:MmcQ/YjbR family DNA-binding protein [Streptomyces sp. XM4193]|uniref:MmcQ/YjbR family DNA-binding protein n=1 Tax=Streptomyces sp. XM4193 TaxID=2929782 RepID=UPI001FFAA5BE|nr:MmcQ/YjbR family DNA-binding protein [Streptomyces sp. XM4193]MCK1799123.1 MmcQ/YjbR family DNA-binding protein [Streptomyces sp. XM4193]